jgi:hypothetical protein
VDNFPISARTKPGVDGVSSVYGNHFYTLSAEIPGIYPVHKELVPRFISVEARCTENCTKANSRKRSHLTTAIDDDKRRPHPVGRNGRKTRRALRMFGRTRRQPREVVSVQTGKSPGSCITLDRKLLPPIRTSNSQDESTRAVWVSAGSISSQ